MKLAIITALHERYGLTRLFLKYYSELVVDGVELGLFCAVTKTENKMHQLVEDFPMWTPTFTENKPLTHKFASSMAHIKDYDAMMIIGSDDFINAGYITEGVKRLASADYIGGNMIHYLNLGTEHMIKQWDVLGNPIGAGRMLSRNLLEHLDWMPWDFSTPGLDNSMVQKMLYEGIVPEVMENYEAFGGAMLDVKMKDGHGIEMNQTPYSTVRRWPHQQVNAQSYLDKYFPSLKQTLLTW